MDNPSWYDPTYDPPAPADSSTRSNRELQESEFSSHPRPQKKSQKGEGPPMQLIQLLPVFEGQNSII
jgi:hypothetical protein